MYEKGFILFVGYKLKMQIVCMFAARVFFYSVLTLASIFIFVIFWRELFHSSGMLTFRPFCARFFMFLNSTTNIHAQSYTSTHTYTVRTCPQSKEEAIVITKHTLTKPTRVIGEEVTEWKQKRKRKIHKN